MSTDESRAIAHRFFEECCNGRNLEIADELFATEHRYHDPSSPSIGSGPEGMKQLLSTYLRAFFDIHWDVDDMFVAEGGGKVVTRWTGHGTHTADLEGIPPTGKRATVQGIWIHRIAGNKIVESWNIWDTLGMLQQLGIIPSRPG